MSRPDPFALEPVFRAYAAEEISLGRARECAAKWAAGEPFALPPPDDGAPEVDLLKAAITRIYRAQVYERGEKDAGVSVDLIAAISDAAALAGVST